MTTATIIGMYVEAAIFGAGEGIILILFINLIKKIYNFFKWVIN